MKESLKRMKAGLIGFSLLVLSLVILDISLGAETKEQQKSLGETVYVKKCAVCHGKDGQGVEKMAKMLKTEIRDVTKITLTPELSKEWQTQIREGKNKMPAFKEKLKEAEIDSVFAYIRSLTLAPVKTKSQEMKPTSGEAKDSSSTEK